MARDAAARVLCDEALRLVDAQPQRAWSLAAQARDLAGRAHDPESAAVAERARGLAALHLADLDTALRCERGAVRLARRAGNPTLAAEARMSLAYVLSCRGQPRRALGVIDRARADLNGVQRLRATAQRGAILQQLGCLGEALETYREVLPRLRACGDPVWTWRVLNNRGVLFVYRYRFAEALADLHEAERLSEAEDRRLLAAHVQENLGFAHSRQGEVPAALRYFEEAERRYRALGVSVSSLLLDRAELLLAVRLAREAREAAEQAVAELTRARSGFKLPEGVLMVAAAALLAGDCTAALPAARQAAAAFARQHRDDWSAVARLMALRCRLGLGQRVAVPELVRVADALQAAGWRMPALDARVTAARLTLERGRPAEAQALLAAAGAARRTDPAELRIRACQCAALRHLSAGRRRAAAATISAGLRIAEEYRATLGADDLLAYCSGHRTELVHMGLRMAIEARSARRVLRWAERGRASHLLLARARPPGDPVLAAALSEVRGVVAELAAARRAGESVAHLERRQAALENRIRDHLRRRDGDYAGTAAPASPEQLTAVLDGAAVLEYVESDGALFAVLLADGRTVLRPLGPAAEIAGSLEHLPFAMRRAAAGNDRSAEAADRLLASLGRRLDEFLVGPVRDALGDRPLVVVPTGALQSMPWGLLPSCAGRSVTVSPSATSWYQAARRPRRYGTTLAVAGPDLPGSAAEIAALHRLYPAAQTLTGASATAGAVLAALPYASIAHVAAHGNFRRDNPLFSSLRLADGPLTVHDLQTLPDVPELVILAACDSGLSLVCPGDELLGFSAALLTMGTRSLVAAMLPVPDEVATVLMTAMHHRLAAGAAPASALAEAGRDLARSGGPAERMTAAGFVCLGAGLGA
ncbi:CHAT domain-containing protein [Actinoplanes teichomyceticus]|uniref:CHAT domain-containing protein n=1 Tax=Actinoplanes teichomyceticus TaxID=1867 RepID=A0A561VMW6_ACTTI|nr:CHAT domain-containing protein [Actinoplanes teichomyceticus]TWG12951.1 CHAT domain-containing protein [Actinoplanes teichomyceticus]GIF16963.1 CHAT domain-containing protein [Actinoplanes teichomyceticus]